MMEADPLPDQKDPNSVAGGSIDQPLPAPVKAYIDEALKKSHPIDNHSHGKSWKRSWRAASPITQATLVLTVGVALATIAYAITAGYQLGEMRHTNDLTVQALKRADQSSRDASEQFQVQLHHYDATLGQTEEIAKQTLAQAQHTEKLANETHVLADSSKAQSELLRGQILLDQRPYIEMNQPLKLVDVLAYQPLEEPVVGKPIAVSIHYGNGGKSNALSVSVVRFVRFGKDAYDIFKIPIQFETRENTMRPGGEPRTTTAVSRRDDEILQSYRIDASNLVNWDGTRPIILLAYFSYKDSFGSSYCTKISDEYVDKGRWVRLDSVPTQIPCIDQPNTEIK